MTNIIDFDARKRKAGRVYCPPLDIYFPALVKITQTFPKDFDFAVVGITPRQQSVVHTFEDSKTLHPYMTEEEAVRCLADGDPFSLVMRHHKDLDSTSVYRASLYDFGIDPAMSFTVVSAQEGYFTLLTRPLTAGQPTPTITYAAEFADPESPVGMNEWLMSIGPDGTYYEEKSRAGDDTDLSLLLPHFD